MLLHPCHACQMGNHDRHHDVVESVPEGIMGGVECPCKGECVDGRYCSPQFVNVLASIKQRNERR